jgi:ferritin-like metal-binding protein YciE
MRLIAGRQSSARLTKGGAIALTVQHKVRTQLALPARLGREEPALHGSEVGLALRDHCQALTVRSAQRNAAGREKLPALCIWAPFTERMVPVSVHGLSTLTNSEIERAQERKDRESLKAREYRDAKGEVHHHTKSYVEQHGKGSGSAGGDRSDGQRSQQRSRDGNPAASNNGRLGELFLVTLKDIYSAEKQMLRAMSKISSQSQSDQLRQALRKHGEETETQVERLEQVFEMLGKPARGKPCEAIEGLISEAQEVMEEFKGSDVLDAGLVSAAQAIEHYEISRYGTLKTWAQELGMMDAAKLLDETLQEEKKTDAILTKIAEERVNQRAA